MEAKNLSGTAGGAADSPRQLQAVVRIAHLLNSPLALDDLLRELVTLAAQVVQAQAASLFRLDPSRNELVFDVVTGPKQEALTRKRLPVGLGVAGWVAQHRTAVTVPDVQADGRFYPAFDVELGFQTKNLLVVPMFLRGELTGVLEAVNRKGETAFTAEDELVLTTFASQAAIAIDNARMQAELLEKARLEQELAIAARMQADLLPKRMPDLPGYDVAARMVPSETIGGDFYDFIPISHDHVGITVADGAGKGIPGALLMALTRSALNVQVTTAYAVRDIIAKLNDHLASETAPHLFVTLFYGALDIPGRRLTYTNAGHPAGLLLRASTGSARPARLSSALSAQTEGGSSRPSADGHPEPGEGRGDGCRRLETGGPLLGVIPGESYEEEQVRLHGGDLLALYSDGVTEAMDPSGEAFSENRLVAALRAWAHLPAVEIVRRVHDEVTRFIGGCSFADDFTLLILRVL